MVIYVTLNGMFGGSSLLVYFFIFSSDKFNKMLILILIQYILHFIRYFGHNVVKKAHNFFLCLLYAIDLIMSKHLFNNSFTNHYAYLLNLLVIFNQNLIIHQITTRIRTSQIPTTCSSGTQFLQNLAERPGSGCVAHDISIRIRRD